MSVALSGRGWSFGPDKEKNLVVQGKQEEVSQQISGGGGGGGGTHWDAPLTFPSSPALLISLEPATPPALLHVSLVGLLCSRFCPSRSYGGCPCRSAPTETRVSSLGFCPWEHPLFLSSHGTPSLWLSPKGSRIRTLVYLGLWVPPQGASVLVPPTLPIGLGQGSSVTHTPFGMFPPIQVGPLWRFWTLLGKGERQREELKFLVHTAAATVTPKEGLWTEDPSQHALGPWMVGMFEILCIQDESLATGIKGLLH